MLTMPELNKRILKLGQQGLSRLVFLEKVSRELLIYTGGDELELRLADEHLQYEWQFNSEYVSDFRTCKFESDPEGNLLPCLSETSLHEQVCRELYKVRYNPELKFHYQKQSILIGDSYHEHRYLRSTGKSLAEESGFGSLIYISFFTDDDIPGLLVIKKRERNFFSYDDKLLYESMAQTLGIAIAFRRSQYLLGERVKELSCLHSISKLLQESELDLDETFERLVKLIPESFQYPAKTGCRIKINGRDYQSADADKGGQEIAEPIYLDKEGIGEIRINITDSELEFLVEEYDLLVSIAGATGALYRKLQAEEDKKEMEEKLRQADRLATIGQLAAGIAHELNEPLSNILGYGQLVSGELEKDSRAHEDVAKIVSSSLHAREIVRKLLLFARQMPINKSEVNLNEIIESSLDIVGSRIRKHNIKLEKELAEDLPLFKADSSQLKQVVINLLVNAEQAMPKGGVLKIKTRHKSGRIILLISDTGMGMSRSLQKKIFMPFFTTKKQGEGTGLGLAVVHGIIQAHLGKIKVRSAIEKGTGITVSFPAGRE